MKQEAIVLQNGEPEAETPGERNYHTVLVYTYEARLAIIARWMPVIRAKIVRIKEEKETLSVPERAFSCIMASRRFSFLKLQGK